MRDDAGHTARNNLLYILAFVPIGQASFSDCPAELEVEKFSFHSKERSPALSRKVRALPKISLLRQSDIFGPHLLLSH